MQGNTFAMNFDESSFEIFMEGFREVMSLLEADLNALQIDPTEKAIILNTLRELHTLKGMCQMSGLDEMTEFVHVIEELADGLKEDKIEFTALIKEAIFMCCDQVSIHARREYMKEQIDYDSLDEVKELILELVNHGAAQQEHLASEVLIRLGSHHINDEDAVEDMLSAHLLEPVQADHAFEGVGDKREFASFTSAPDRSEQLSFFCKLSMLLDNRLVDYKGRTLTLSEAVQGINKELDSPLQEEDLEAAVYMHDVGLSFFSDTVHAGVEIFNLDSDLQLMTHPELARQFLNNMGGWEVAEEIVAQHHERVDGKGYPNQLKADEICLGAKILAVAIAFDDQTHGRDGYAGKRSLFRVLTDINASVGSLFDADIVRAFNSMIKGNYLEHKFLPIRCEGTNREVNASQFLG